MNKVIWKFSIMVEDSQTVEMPIGAQILSVGMQDENARIWALVDPSAHKEKRLFELFGTGHPIPSGDGIERKFIGTLFIYGSSLVFHLFERI